MPDTKQGRDKQARDAEKRRRRRDVEESLERGDEEEPPQEEAPRTCHRRDCNELAAFLVLERYQEETGQGAVEAEAYLCRAHTAEESPTNLDGVYEDYVFRVEPIAEDRSADET
ncbi:hypothetical protein [Halogeometricum sp. CBA1124]|uniref:hypothetical protein n=1 Tax=Halogeometricum sp. CBA1124 TaxID=2668071 RepID=UPI00142C6E1A|nr:hypothetical protein [Halogeometricum sp. CBA1124]MUV57443.1 hypothetical protein [Halogeometricum sp. CBA1124]